MPKTVFKLRIDVDISEKSPEAAWVRLGEILQENRLKEKARAIRLQAATPYEMGTCYICNRTRPAQEMQLLGKDTYRCPTHKQATVLKKGKEIKARKAREERKKQA